MFGIKSRRDRMRTPLVHEFTRYLGELLTLSDGYTSYSVEGGVLHLVKKGVHLKVTIEEMPVEND